MAKYMIPLDGSPLAEEALGYARRMVTAEHDELIFLSVVEHTALSGVAPDIVHRAEEESRQYLAELDRSWRSEGYRVRSFTRRGRARDEIVFVAGEKKADGIIMTSHGRTGPARWLLGSVTEQVCRKAPCPVWVVRRKHTSPVRKVMVPLDGSKEAEQALDLATRLPGGKPEALLLVSATDLVPLGMGSYRTMLLNNLRDYLACQTERLQAQGLNVRPHLIDGVADQGLLDLAAAEEVDLIAMTTHGRGGWQRFYMGSVAERILRHSPCPVLLVSLAGVPAEV